MIRNAWQFPYTSNQCISELQSRTNTDNTFWTDWAGTRDYLYDSCTQEESRRRYEDEFDTDFCR